VDALAEGGGRRGEAGDGLRRVAAGGFRKMAPDLAVLSCSE